MSSSAGPQLPSPGTFDVEVRGSVPPGLSGRIIGIANGGVVHVVSVGPGQAASYRTQLLHLEATLHNVVAFGGTIIALGDDSLGYELGVELSTFRAVDLAGQGRVVAPFPKHDPVTGDLHLVARSNSGPLAHVVVTAGALTRRERTILDAPQRITDLALTADHVVFAASGFVGIAPRDGEARTTWIATGAAAPHPVHSHDSHDAVVLIALTPSLERWTLNAGEATVDREVLDSTPRRFAHVHDSAGAPQCVWTSGDAISRHDLNHPRRVDHRLRSSVAGDFAVVADGDWLVGLVDDTSGATTELQVIDAADITAPPVAAVRIPRSIPAGMRCTWIPANQSSTQQTTSTKEDRP